MSDKIVLDSVSTTSRFQDNSFGNEKIVIELTRVIKHISNLKPQQDLKLRKCSSVMSAVKIKMRCLQLMEPLNEIEVVLTMQIEMLLKRTFPGYDQGYVVLRFSNGSHFALIHIEPQMSLR